MYSKNDKRTQRIDELVAEVNRIPLNEIIGRVVDLVPRNSHYLGLCPFHGDHHIGSFVVTPQRNIWKCFACGEGGNGISFERKYYQLEFVPAVLKLSLDFGIIDHEEFETLSNGKYDAASINEIQRRAESEKKDIKRNQRASDDILNVVYRAMAEICGLSEKDRKHLIEVRGLKEPDLVNYFTYPTKRTYPLNPTDWEHMDRGTAQYLYGKTLEEATSLEKKEIGAFTREVVKKASHSLSFTEVCYMPPKALSLPSKIIRKIGYDIAEKKGYTEEYLTRERISDIENAVSVYSKALPFVPGFFVNEKGEADYLSYRGIGLLCEDDRKKVVGVQIRRDHVKEGETRYVWMSSSFAEFREDYQGGTSAGSPGGYIPAKIQRPGRIPSLYITEGRFKAEQIAAGGDDAIYVSGVSTWKSIIPMVKRVRGNRVMVFIAFDSDAMGNVAVHRQLSLLAEELKREGLDTKLVLWSKSLGKGFDDLVLNVGKTYRSHLRYLEYSEFETQYSEALNMVLSEYGVTRIPEINKDKIADFSKTLQSTVEKELRIS